MGLETSLHDNQAIMIMLGVLHIALSILVMIFAIIVTGYDTSQMSEEQVANLERAAIENTITGKNTEKQSTRLPYKRCEDC